MKCIAAVLVCLLCISCNKTENMDREKRGVPGTTGTRVDTLVVTKEQQEAMSPTQVLTELKNGNLRFLNDSTITHDRHKEIALSADDQHPMAIVLSCIDSRIPTETVLDQSIADIFNVRIAGNYVNTDILGSMEFACKVKGAKVILVMGHTSCGAVKGACDDVQLGNLTQVISNIKPAVDSVQGYDGNRTSKNHEFVESVSKMNVLLTMKNITQQSPILKEMADSGKIMIAGCMYDVATGKVEYY